MGRCSGRGSGASLEDAVQDLAKRGTGGVAAGISSCLGRRENGAATAVCVRCDKRVDPALRGVTYMRRLWAAQDGERGRLSEQIWSGCAGTSPSTRREQSARVHQAPRRTNGRWKMEIPAKGGGRHRLLY